VSELSTDRRLIEYLRRSYTATDGLWFMIVEQAHDFEHALALDEQVWQIMPKIQARKAREVLDIAGNSLDDLIACFTLKLQADGHQFRIERSDNEVRFIITHCKWRELLRKSDREDIEPRISTVIWPAELAGWCSEFGGQFEFDYTDEGRPAEEYRIIFRRAESTSASGHQRRE